METDFRRFSISILIVLFLGLLPVCSDSLAGSASLKSQMVKMRDGVHLSTNVYFEGEVKKGRPSMSPTVPPISQIMKSTSVSPIAKKSFISFVTCGITWIVLPR